MLLRSEGAKIDGKPIRSEPWNQFEFIQTDGLVKIYNKYGGNIGLFVNKENSFLDSPTVYGQKETGDWFEIEQTSDGSCVIIESDSDQALEGIRIDGEYKEGSPILLKTKNRSTNQQWKLEPYGQPIVNQYLPYRIKNRATGKVMQTGIHSHEVVVKEFDQKKNLVFYFDIAPESFDYFYIRSNESGSVLDIEYSHLLQWRKQDASFQRMKLVLVETIPEGPKYYKIVPESQPDKGLIARSYGSIQLAELKDDDLYGHWEFKLATEPIKLLELEREI